MARDILKVRKVGGTLVVTMTQAILDQIPLTEGDRVLIEAFPPKRIIISREEKSVPTTRRVELEIAVLEAKVESFDSQKSASIAEYNSGSGIDSDDLDCHLKYLKAESDKVIVDLAQKRLELFDLQGA